ncbi:MAG TPA: sulfite exporter TauE/SafE family protein [Spirochaetota bacterium]
MEHIYAYILLFAAALFAGAVNSVAGGGSLISFPMLIALGVSPIQANATNTAAVWPGSLSSALAYRKDTALYKGLLMTLVIPSVIGGLLGAVVLVVTPPDMFMRIVPFLVLFATLLFAFKGMINRLFKVGKSDGHIGVWGHVFGFIFQGFVATYGGYFGAGIGIIMLGSLSVLGLHDIHRMNGLKTILGTLINVIAFIFFAYKGLVIFHIAILMAVGTIIGGYVGARSAKKIDQRYIRAAVICVGLIVSGWLFMKR